MPPQGPPEGYLDFPGINNVISFSYTRSHGIQPGIASLQITPQDEDIPTTNQVMTISYGDLSFEFWGCIIDKASIHTDPGSPQIVSVSIKDRRWMWQYGEITGHYNLRLSDGTIDVATQKTTQQLASLLLDAMGEEDYDVSALSTLPYPEADWDYSNPAQELEHLAESLGCRVVLTIDETVLIALVGQGSALPDDPSARTVDFGIDPQDLPDKVKVVGGPTRYQTTFRLRAVGQEKDQIINAQYDNNAIPNLISGDVVDIGKIKPIELLSYAPNPSDPNGGWTSEWMAGRAFASITTPEAVTAANPKGLDLEAQKRARETVYRWYQIMDTADNGPMTNLCNILGYFDNPVQPWQCCPLEDGMVATYVEDVAVLGVPPTGQETVAEHPLPPYLRGKWHQENPDFGINDTFRLFPYPFTIDKARGIVRLPFPVVRLDPASQSKFLPAELYLTIAHSVKDADTRQPDRFTTSRNVGPQQGAGTEILHREDVVRRVISGVTLSDMTLTLNPLGLSDTQDSCQKEAGYYLDAYIAGLQNPQTAHVEYNGILPISCDGAIAQVEWSGGPNGAMTKASINTEFSLVVPSYQQRREISRVRFQVHLNALAHGHSRRLRKQGVVVL